MNQWLQRIKDVLFDLMSQIMLMWIPALCDIGEKTDNLTRRGL
jgi:hypothetical protein